MTDKKADEKKKQRLLKRLAKYAEGYDPEAAHADADIALLEYIDDPEIRDAYSKIEKWYA